MENENTQTPIVAEFSLVSNETSWGKITGNIEEQKDLTTLIEEKTGTFTFEQGVASDTWIIEHNLDKYPSFVAVDSAGNVQIPDEVVYDNKNQITVTFLAEFAGYGYLN